MILILPQKLTTTFCTNEQGKHICKGFTLIRDVLSRACGRAFRHKILMTDFIYKCLNFKDGSAKAPAVRYLLVKWPYECSVEPKILPQTLDNTPLIRTKPLEICLPTH